MLNIGHDIYTGSVGLIENVNLRYGNLTAANNTFIICVERLMINNVQIDIYTQHIGIHVRTFCNYYYIGVNYLYIYIFKYI